MHICCSNCFIYPLKALSARDIEIRGFWFNPNIHPFAEYAMRLESVRRLQRMWNLDIVYDDTYGFTEFVRSVVFDEENRCAVCYAMRLEATARIAKRMKLDGFTTSLLVSPYQKFDAIVRTGEEAGKTHSIPFYAEDFRPGWRDGINVSGELGLYRQKYCGCAYSEMEKHRKTRNKKTVDRRQNTGDGKETVKN